MMNSRISGRKAAVMAAGALFLAAAGAAAVPPSQERHDVTVTNVAVPVRVYQDGRFVEGLTPSDFEIYEGGRLQKLQGFYCIDRGTIEGRESFGEPPPDLARHFFLLFQVQEYHPKFSELIGDLFQTVLRPGDTLSVQTPLRTYVLSRQATAVKSKEVLIEEMAQLLKDDILAGNTDYNDQLIELKRIVRSIAEINPLTGMDEGPVGANLQLLALFPRYREAVGWMEATRVVDERKFLQFAGQIKGIEGQKSVFLIYQREFRPELQQPVVNRIQSEFRNAQEILSELQNLFLTRKRETSFVVEPIQKAFSDALIDFHLIYMNKETEYVPGIDMREVSENHFRAFSILAETTGGIVDGSQNPAVGFRNAVGNAGKYYLLYFEPIDYKRDGEFHRLAVKVKNPAYRVVSRTGYYAN